MRLALLAVVSLVLAAPACATFRAGETGTTDLTIRYWAQGRADGGTARTWTLRCAPARGTLPKPVAACAKLAALDRPFAPTSKDMVCTDLYGGPAEAIVSGRFEGRRIWARLTRTNGCEIGRFERVRFLIPAFHGDNE